MVKEKVEKAIENEIFKTGKMGTEDVHVRVRLTEEEKEEFFELDCFDDEEHYSWGFDDDEPLLLHMIYTEE